MIKWFCKYVCPCRECKRRKELLDSIIIKSIDEGDKLPENLGGYINESSQRRAKKYSKGLEGYFERALEWQKKNFKKARRITVEIDYETGNYSTSDGPYKLYLYAYFSSSRIVSESIFASDSEDQREAKWEHFKSEVGYTSRIVGD